MKHNIFFMFIQLVFSIRLGSSVSSNPLLSSPIGPYQVIIKQVNNCNATKNNKIQYNLYVSHKENSTVILGNSTYEVPFDDTFFLEIYLALKDSFGNWKENVYIHKVANACSSLKKLAGNAGTAFVHGLGIKSTNCPVLPGIYIANGLNPSIFEEFNMPKVFYYGTHKLHVQYSRKNEKFGCQVYILEFKRR